MSTTIINSPAAIELLLHFHCCPDPHPQVAARVPAYIELVEYFEDVGAISERKDRETYGTTDKGRAWVAAICNTPPPVQKWVDARDGSKLEFL